MSYTPEIVQIHLYKLKVIAVVILDDDYDSHVLLKLVTFKMCHVCRLKVETLVLGSVVIREAVRQG